MKVTKISFRKKLFTIITLVTMGSVMFAPPALAVPPDDKYAPGATLTPNCLPGSANCSVTPLASSGANTNITSLSSLSTTTWSTGATITAGSYQIGRDGDATNQLHFNVPTSATMEWSINDAARMVLSATTLNAKSNSISWDGGVAVTAANYEIVRDGDATNQLHFNVPTGASFEWSVNDTAEATLSATAVNFQNNSITTTGGGSLTGTWSDLGSVTTVDINGGTVDGATIGGSVAGAITGTTITANTNFVPDADDGAGLGLSGTAFSDLFLAAAAVINFGAGDVTITHATDLLTFAGAANGFTFNSPVNLGTVGPAGTTGILKFNGSTSGTITVQPANAAGTWTLTLPADNGDVGQFLRTDGEGVTTWVTGSSSGATTALDNLASVAINTALVLGTSDGAALGSATKMWSDLFLASGGVINWNNGDYTITHAAGALTLAPTAQSSGVPTAFTITGAAHTGLTAATEDIGVNVNLSATKTWAAGAGPLATQREFVVQAPTYAGNAGGALTITSAGTFVVTGAPTASTNMTITRPYAIWSQAGANKFTGPILGGTAVVSSGAQYVSELYGSVTGSTGLISSLKNTATDGYAFNATYNDSGNYGGFFTYGSLYATTALRNNSTIAASKSLIVASDGATASGGTEGVKIAVGGYSNFATPIATIAGPSGATTFAPLAAVGGVHAFTITPGAYTAVTSQINDFTVSAHTMTITGAITAEAFSVFNQPTISAASALTVTTAKTLDIVAAPTVASSALITNAIGLNVGNISTGPTIANTASSTYAAINVATHTITLNATTQVTSANFAAGLKIGQITVAQSGGAVTADQASSLYIVDAPAAGASVTLTNKYAIFVDGGSSRFDGRILGFKGAEVTPAATVTLGDGNTFSVAASATAIDCITTTGWTAGSTVTFVFPGVSTVNDSTGGCGAGTANVDLMATFISTANDTLTIVYDGTNWKQVSSATN